MATTTFSGVANNAKTTLSASITALATTWSVASGSSLPSTTFYATIFDTDPDVNEIVKVTARSGASLTTVVRGQQGTAASAWGSGANFQVLWTKSNVDELTTAINNLETRLGSGTTDVTITTGDLDMLLSGAVLNPTFTSYNGGANNLVADFKIGRGTLASPAIVNNLDEIALKFSGHDGTAHRQFAVLKAYINGTPGASDMPGAFAFQVSPDGSATPATALTLAQDKSAAFAGAITGASTINVTGAATFQSTLQSYGDITSGNTGAANRRMIVNANSGFRADFYLGGSGTALRWIFSKSSDTETGSDAGSYFDLNAYNDSGVFIDRVFRALRAQHGAFTISRPLVTTAGRRDTPYTITYAATITPDIRNGSYQVMTFGAGNVTIASIANVTAGDIFEIVLVQDATGSRTASWNSNYKFFSGDSGTLTTTASKKDWFRFRAYSATEFHCVALKKNV